MKQKQNETEHLLSTETNKKRLLEDAAERLYPYFSNVLRQMAKETFMEGAKWQEQQTIEEVFEWLTTNDYLTDLKQTLIENFKKNKI